MCKIGRHIVQKTVLTRWFLQKKEYSNDLREIVIKRFLNGDSERETARKVLILRISVHYMITKHKSTNCIGNIIDRGRKRKTEIRTDHVIQRKIKTNRCISSSSVKGELQNELNITISETTIRRRAHKVGLFGRVARKNSYVNKVNRGKRLEYARNISKKASWILESCSLVG